MSDQMEVPPQSRETRAAFERGYDTGIKAAAIVSEDYAREFTNGLVQAMCNLMRTKVPRP